MSRHSFLAALLGALLSTAAFAQFEVSTYTITSQHSTEGLPSIFTVRKGTMQLATSPYQSIQAAINAIRADACDSDIPVVTSVPIRFGLGDNGLDIDRATANFGNIITGEGVGGVNWCNFVLEGKITSAVPQSAVEEGEQGTVNVGAGVYLTSTADIANTSGPAITMMGGSMMINGGTVAGNGNATVAFPMNGGGGTVILGGSPTITGNIQVPPRALSVITAGDDIFNPPEGKQYRLLIYGNDGDVAVVNGAGHASNFRLEMSGIRLEASGNDLVLTTNPTPIAHSPLPAIHSEATAYYNMKGEPMGSAKPATPGVYLVKQGSSIRKVVVR